MGEPIEKLMLPFKVQQLLNTIIEKKRMGISDAMQYLYSSDLYAQLALESSYLWQLSAYNLYDLLKKEKRRKKQTQNNSTEALLFLSFCLENYKEHKKISAEEALFLFQKYKVLDFLENVFDALHTQSKDYIMCEIDTYIRNQKRKK